jgi:selenocysteine-specific elongation factor
MTIDLGYAYWPQPDGRVLGFIDVPGHEKFLSNMLAGVGVLTMRCWWWRAMTA